MDPEVRYLWLVAAIAKEFGVLPHVAERDLASDPQRISLACLTLVQYAAARSVFKSADKKAISAYGGRMMELVHEIDAEIAEEELRAAAEGMG